MDALCYNVTKRIHFPWLNMEFIDYSGMITLFIQYIRYSFDPFMRVLVMK